MAKLKLDTKKRIVISLTDEIAGRDLIDAIEGGKILSGEGVPPNSLGDNGELYLNLTDGDLYKKFNNSWVLQQDAAEAAGTFSQNQVVFSLLTAPPATDETKAALFVKSDGELYLKRGDGSEDKISGKASMKIESRVITATEADQKFLTLQAAPSEPENISLIIGYGGGIQIKGLSFDISEEDSTTLYWYGKSLDGFIEEGDIFLLHYLTMV